MCVLLIKVPIRKMSVTLFNDPRMSRREKKTLLKAYGIEKVKTMTR